MINTVHINQSIFLCRNEIKCIWSTNYSVRHNQDNQREYEEIAFQTLSENLLKKNLFEKKIEHNNIIKKMNYFSGKK